MTQNAGKEPVFSNGRAALENMHSLFLEALRHREQEIVRYMALLVPALGGFVWLVHKAIASPTPPPPGTTFEPPISDGVFVAGTLGVLLLLLLGAVYSLSLGYNFRYITLQLAKLEAVLGIRGAILKGWPRTPQQFLDRYKILCRIPWCTPPDIIEVFRRVFLVSIAGITVAASVLKPEGLVLSLVIPAGSVCFLLSIFSPAWYGRKLSKKAEEELEDSDNWSDRTVSDAAHRFV